MDNLLHARLVNAEGELIAEGSCWLNEAVGQATLEPEREPGVLQKERGELRLELESGRSLPVSDKPMIFNLRSRGAGAGHNGRRRLYRLWLINDAQDADAAGAAGNGAPAGQEARPEIRETPAAR